MPQHVSFDPAIPDPVAGPTADAGSPRTTASPALSAAWADLLGRLMKGEYLAEEEASRVLTSFFEGEAPPPVVAAVLVLMRQREESVAELLGFARAMASRMLTVPVDGDVLDTCGTGGDRQGTINVSTAAGLVAGAAGARVLKHGGRAASSKTGSADVLERLGVDISLDPDGVAQMVNTKRFGFALATRFHPAMAAVAPVRRALGIPTAFNFLGPLVNPGHARYQLVGVFDRRLAPSMAAVLKAQGSVHALVVCGDDGMDEVSLSSSTTVWEVRAESEVERYEIAPGQFGLATASLATLQGGDATENAAVLRGILSGDITDARRDLVALNAGAALYASDRASSIAEGLALALETLASGHAGEYLQELIESQPERSTMMS
ncbi:anthranilate phosphoribosyltransferase [Ferrimicrobium sp.]|uniref:anthranilate phosphoribosyltransferase n=1 Tax=Ferrimicrobium sp. TaxID=2926050 RepID=UPI00261C8351|nr:anthranilate phosphoribosyltransferase [Ferrimicrobium sp.]